MAETLRVGVIAPIINDNFAWGKSPHFSENKLKEFDDEIFNQIRIGFRRFNSLSEQPKIILIPELAVQKRNERRLKDLAIASGAVIISGMDFHFPIEPSDTIANRAIVIVPHGWPKGSNGRNSNTFYFGKTFFSYEELGMFSLLEPKRKAFAESNMFILDAGPFGNIGVAICSDFFDIARFHAYQGKIHHLFLISINKDTTSYYHLSEAIGRLVYCNVVVCNTGQYGGSLAFSPKKEAHERTIFKADGANLVTYQCFDLPVNSLDRAQGLDYSKPNDDLEFKASPPGYPRRDREPKSQKREVRIQNLGSSITKDISQPSNPSET